VTAGRPDVLALCYHAVSERWSADLAVTPERLEEQVSLLLRRGYRPATFTEAVLEPPAARTLAVTFDDAFRSVLQAVPILERLGVPATLFVPTRLVGTGEPMRWPGIEEIAAGPHAQELVGLSWEEIGSLAEAGWEIGSHTRTHARLVSVPDATLEDELAGSRRDVAERLGRPCRSLAYPYGDLDPRVVACAARAGYAAAASPPLARRAGPVRLTWPRVGAYQKDVPGRLRAKSSPAVRRLQSTRFGEPLAAVVRGSARV
jgi:peptidoglycan/xylan/chitin deacetylase (PgdA/CDA1 family)